ncbi:helix-turn-helix domain-containing protein [Lysinibacillus sp. UGB7]|uniref:helix-turn-helix domain-containing protein n=1 Tax=Lysinibacillus sp. UGB7 TaxID=3411039 RepID=UPI003B7BFAAA
MKQIKTLQAFFDCNFYIYNSSFVLNSHIHRLTLSYRLNKIREFTGYDPQYFDDVVMLKMACSLRLQ